MIAIILFYFIFPLLAGNFNEFETASWRVEEEGKRVGETSRNEIKKMELATGGKPVFGNC